MVSYYSYHHRLGVYHSHLVSYYSTSEIRLSLFLKSSKNLALKKLDLELILSQGCPK